ncbi:hypothetical protein M8C21_034031, partial [Ambrosia artemisiifolia]
IGVLKRKERGSIDNGPVVVATFPAAARVRFRTRPISGPPLSLSWPLKSFVLLHYLLERTGKMKQKITNHNVFEINNEGLEIRRRQSCSTKHVALETSEELDLHTRALMEVQVMHAKNQVFNASNMLPAVAAKAIDGWFPGLADTIEKSDKFSKTTGFIGVQLRSTISRKYGVCNFLNRVNTGVLCSLLGHGNDGNGSVPSQGTIVLVQGAGGISAAAAAFLITTPLDTVNTQLHVMGHDKRPNTRQLIKTLITEDWLESIQGFSPINSKMFHGGRVIEAKMLNAIL